MYRKQTVLELQNVIKAFMFAFRNNRNVSTWMIKGGYFGDYVNLIEKLSTSL